MFSNDNDADHPQDRAVVANAEPEQSKALGCRVADGVLNEALLKDLERVASNNTATDTMEATVSRVNSHQAD